MFTLAVLLLAMLWVPVQHSSGQTEGAAFERKADLNLKRVYATFRRQAEAAETQFNAELRRLLKQRVGLAEKAGRTLVGVIVRLPEVSEDALAVAQTRLEARGFGVRARLGNIAVLQVPVDELPALAAEASVVKLEAAEIFQAREERGGTQLVSNKAAAWRAANDAANASVRAAEARALNNLTGRGVVVGVIDSGIDWKHADFRKADGTTRIKALWDMSDASETGPGGVGRVYTEAQINAALNGQGSVAEADLNNHGTHVTGTAAGNGRAAGGGVAAGTFAGIAPEADLVIVKGTRNTDNKSSFREDDQIAALQWITARAAELNAPFVINMSLGGHASQHDGTDAVEVAIDNLLATGTGRQVVIAAGNEGQDAIHVGGRMAQGGTANLGFALNPGAQGMFLLYNARDTMTVSVIKPNGATVGPLALNSAITTDADVDIEHSTGSAGTNTNGVGISFKNSLEGLWQLRIQATKVVNGRIDVWAVDDGGAEFDPEIADGLYHVGTPATSRRAISVANFVTKTQYTDSTNKTQTRPQQGQVGQGALSSSPGPTRDGRLKPEIAAPGTFVMSSMSADVTPAIDATDVAPTGKHNVYFGTSMATPVTSGTVALMLQANRNLTADQLKRLLIRAARNDSFTGPSVSYKFGYGKLDAFGAVKAALDGVAAKEFVSISAASFSSAAVAAPESIVTGFGTALAAGTVSATATPLPTSLGGVAVNVTDSAGVTRPAPLYFVSPTQVNYQIPVGTALGTAQIEVLRDGASAGRGSLSINSVWPALFTANASGGGLGAAVVLRVRANGQQVFESVANPIDLGTPADKVFLVLFGTGFRGRSSLDKISVTLGGQPLPVSFAGKQGGLVGVDQMNIELPPSLSGRGQLELLTYVDTWIANTIQFTIK